MALRALTLSQRSAVSTTECSEHQPCAASGRTVGLLIGALVYLQLLVLILLYLVRPGCSALRPALLTGAALLVLLRILKRAFPKVSAS